MSEPSKPNQLTPSSSTDRAKKYLQELKAANGQRLVIDLNEEAKDALRYLLKNGYASSQKEAVMKALIAERKKLDEKK